MSSTLNEIRTGSIITTTPSFIRWFASLSMADRTDIFPDGLPPHLSSVPPPPHIKCDSCDCLYHPEEMFHDGDEPTEVCRKCNDQDWLCEGCEEEFHSKWGEADWEEDRDGGKWCQGCFQEKMTCGRCGDDCGAYGGLDCQENLFLPHDADGINKTGRAKCEDCLTPAAKERLKALREARKPIITAGDAYEALVAMP